MHLGSSNTHNTKKGYIKNGSARGRRLGIGASFHCIVGPECGSAPGDSPCGSPPALGLGLQGCLTHSGRSSGPFRFECIVSPTRRWPLRTWWHCKESIGCTVVCRRIRLRRQRPVRPPLLQRCRSGMELVRSGIAVDDTGAPSVDRQGSNRTSHHLQGIAMTLVPKLHAWRGRAP